MGVTLVRVKAKKLADKKKATLRDIVGVPSICRMTALILISSFFVAAQVALHFVYLTTETNRAIFSSFRHFETSEDVNKDPATVLLIIINALFALIYATLYIIEAIRSFLAFQRLQFS